MLPLPNYVRLCFFGVLFVIFLELILKFLVLLFIISLHFSNIIMLFFNIIIIGTQQFYNICFSFSFFFYQFIL